MTDRDPDWVQAEIIEPADAGGAMGTPGVPGPDRGPSRPPRTRSRTRWALGVLGVVVLVVAVTAVARRGGQGPDIAGPVGVNGSGVTDSRTDAPSMGASPATASGSTAGSPSTGPPSSLAPRTLPGTFARLEEDVTVYGFTAGTEHYPPTVMRLDLAGGIEVDTPLPALQSTGPVSVVAQPDGVIVRPWDSVAGYRVQDGRSATPLVGWLADGGPALPGPVPGTVWVPAPFAQTGFTTMSLVDGSGRPLGRHVTLGPDDGFPLSDGAGGIVVVRPGRRIVALADDTATRSVAPAGRLDPRTAPVAAEIGIGRFLAAGPSGYLYLGCAVDERCPLRYVDRHGQPIASVNLPPDTGTVLGGVLSPDGSHAALSVEPLPSADGAPSPVPDVRPAAALVLVDLASSDATLVRWINPNPAAGAGALVWLPDSSWLLVATGGSDVEAVDPDLDRGTAVGVVFVPYLTRLVVRPGS